jgi:hypothetical protein
MGGTGNAKNSNQDNMRQLGVHVDDFLHVTQLDLLTDDWGYETEVWEFKNQHVTQEFYFYKQNDFGNNTYFLFALL